ncbi:hypothetical protein [Vulcanisaeta distributa]|uniref:Transcriptional regulator n=1 Tax=Vulcanisaeta distributa (strain DSM 14429 / JCM 11212 / NBRC 100878 / IC-017) TaxID=572478 RepID=E1QQR8_VULDI|nr:hypothetical protein [Vulcanisaeta distributa]ADN51680.1 hypothetical protein Vdis_2312 [Vulcanisaeta distributa DSM 14429]
MANVELNKLVEILNYLLEHGASSTYDIYRNTRLSLATTYRYVKKAAGLGYVEVDDMFVDITIKGILLLAILGNEYAAYRLSRIIGFKDGVIKSFINVIRNYSNIIDVLNSTEIKSIKDILSLLLSLFNNNLINVVKYSINTLLEPLIAYLIINFIPGIKLPNGSKIVISNEGVIAIACSFKDEHCPYGKDSIYRNSNDGFVYRLMCRFDCIKRKYGIDDINININIGVNSHFNSVEIHFLNQARKC